MIRLCENENCRASCDIDRACPFGCEDGNFIIDRPFTYYQAYGTEPMLENSMCVDYPDPESGA
jgi:hypothetical protein